MQYLSDKPGVDHPEHVLAQVDEILAHSGKPIVVKDDVVRLEAAEQARAKELGLTEYKFKTNPEMLAALEAVSR
jgi:hypothetical protein